VVARIATVGTAASCVVDLPEDADTPGEFGAGSASGSGPASRAPANGLIEGAVGSYTLGNHSLSVISGSVGPGVRSITLRNGGEEAIATITDGLYAAWLPGSVFDGADAPSGTGGPDAMISYDLVLDDGTIIVDAKSSFP
jgi:hypothetical protein